MGIAGTMFTLNFQPRVADVERERVSLGCFHFTQGFLSKDQLVTPGQPRQQQAANRRLKLPHVVVVGVFSLSYIEYLMYITLLHIDNPSGLSRRWTKHADCDRSREKIRD
jgi:hypothetical protein